MKVNTHGTTARGLALLMLAAVIVSAGALEPVEAQERWVRLDGRVQWIAGQRMAVQLDSGGSVSVDLFRVPQDEYAVLTPGERIVVIGVIPDGGRGVLGRSVARGASAVQAP